MVRWMKTLDRLVMSCSPTVYVTDSRYVYYLAVKKAETLIAESVVH